MSIVRLGHSQYPYTHVDNIPVYRSRLRSQRRKNYSDTKRRPSLTKRESFSPFRSREERNRYLYQHDFYSVSPVPRASSPNLRHPPTLSSPSTGRNFRYDPDTYRLELVPDTTEAPSTSRSPSPTDRSEPIPVFCSSPSPSHSNEPGPSNLHSSSYKRGELTIWNDENEPQTFEAVEEPDNCDYCCSDWFPRGVHWHPKGGSEAIIYKY